MEFKYVRFTGGVNATAFWEQINISAQHYKVICALFKQYSESEYIWLASYLFLKVNFRLFDQQWGV